MRLTMRRAAAGSRSWISFARSTPANRDCRSGWRQKWPASERLFTFYRYLHLPEQKQLSGQIGLPANVLQNWLFCLNYIRNLCAHHSRLWNRELGYPSICARPKKPPGVACARDTGQPPDFRSSHFA